MKRYIVLFLLWPALVFGQSLPVNKDVLTALPEGFVKEGQCPRLEQHYRNGYGNMAGNLAHTLLSLDVCTTSAEMWKQKADELQKKLDELSK